ncbi:MAG: CmpA/NrtA family ABC transporter substrate-binding protein [Candidatus Competibacterales bacterium]
MALEPHWVDPIIDPRHGLEKTNLTLGFVPLTDCAPLVVALEKGLFAQCGLDVELSRESSWASVRDKVAVGLLDGAHLLAGIPLAASLGVGAPVMTMVTALSLGLNGNAITVSNALFERMAEVDAGAYRPATSARALGKMVANTRASSKPPRPLTFAMVYPVSTHHYLLRQWLALGGIDLKEVEIVVVPPPLMVDQLAKGAIDGFCVGEPWNALAVHRGLGKVVITSYELWNNHPEKVFGVHRAWAERHPHTHQALLVALLQASHWLDDPQNRQEAVDLLARGAYVDAPREVIAASLTGHYPWSAGEEARALGDFHVFYRYAATFPWRSHARLLLAQMRACGQLKVDVDLDAVAAQVYRPDLYRQAARCLRLPYPTVDYKPEGINGDSWMLAEATSPIAMGPDRWLGDLAAPAAAPGAVPPRGSVQAPAGPCA